MLRYMLDTDISIYTIKNKPPHLKTLFNSHQGALCISTITLMELLFGAENSSNPQKNLEVVEGFASRLSVLEYNEDAAAHTAQIRAGLKQKGTPIGPYDTMLAGHARSRGLVLVTNNIKEFQRVEGLRIENWAED